MKSKQLLYYTLLFLLVGIKIVNAQTNSMRLMETIKSDTYSHISSTYFNGNTLVFGKLDGSVEFWDYYKNGKSQTYKKHTGEITAVTLNNNGTYIAGASKDNTIKIWNIKAGEEVYSFSQDSSIIIGLITTLIFNDELNVLISIDENNNIQTWNTNELMYK